MGIMRRFCKRVLAVYLLGAVSLYSSAAMAVETMEPTTFYGKYDFTWAGIRLGKLELGFEIQERHYSAHLVVVSAGIVNLFTRHESDTTVNGDIVQGKFHPKIYESNYKTKKKPRHIRLVYNKAGEVTEELNEPPEDRNVRPEVPADKKKGSYDPLTGFLALRAGVLEMNAFDAKRLYLVTAALKGTESLTVMGDDKQTKDYVFARVPLAGMTAKETKEYKEGEPPLHVYFSDDKLTVPVYISMPIMMGSVKGSLVKICDNWDECRVK